MKLSNYHHRTTCRICDSKDLTKFLDLGDMPLANAFVSNPNETELLFPLSVYFCNQCSLVQVLDVVDPKLLFSNYYYLTSTSPQLIEHFKEHSKNVLKYVESKHDLVVDIGGNDGTLLTELKDHCRVLNVEPAKNIAEISLKKGIETVNDFFLQAVYGIITKYGHAKVVTANNVIAHTDSVKELFFGVKELLADDGVFIFETHWVGNLIGKGGFDQIYHEHLCYYSLHALTRLCDLVGLSIFDVELVPLNGQSLQVYVSRNRKAGPSVKMLLEREKNMHLDTFSAFAEFSNKVTQTKSETLNLLLALEAQGKNVVGYGASAKGSTLLNFYGITDLEYVTDTSPLKQGLFIPGVHIPIVPPERLYAEKPDYVLLLAWNYAISILEKEKELRAQGVKFIIPVPSVKIV